MPLSRRRAVAALAAAPFVAKGAHAQPAFPSKPLTLVIPFPAGGPSDVFGRHLAQALTGRLGQSVVVENKSGAAGVTGVDFVAKAPNPDLKNKQLCEAYYFIAERRMQADDKANATAFYQQVLQTKETQLSAYRGAQYALQMFPK